jgi:hypothetical protein
MVAHGNHGHMGHLLYRGEPLILRKSVTSGVVVEPRWRLPQMHKGTYMLQQSFTISNVVTDALIVLYPLPFVGIPASNPYYNC